MNFRKRSTPALLSFQIAPMVDIFLVLLVFFILTWNFAISENALDVKVPTAASAKEQESYVNQVVVNVRKDGTIVLNRQAITREALKEKLGALSELYPDHAVILRGDEDVAYRDLIAVLDICRSAKIWNIDFATAGQSQ